MSEDGLLHTAELLKTALPYVDIRSRLTLELLVKLYELIICMRNFTNKDVTACGFENEKADMETLLNNIRPRCNKSEQDFVDKMLNIFQAKKMFEMYNTYMEAMNAMQGFEGFGGGDADDDSTDSFMNNFKDYDFSSIFGDDFDVESFMNSYKTMSSDNNDDNEYKTDNRANEHSNIVDAEEATDFNRTSNNDIVNDTEDYDSMFEELKTMIAPDQIQTFEKLRMLFGSTSYDDSNKPNGNME